MRAAAAVRGEEDDFVTRLPESADGIQPEPTGIRDRSEAARATADTLLERSAELLQRSLALRERIGRIEWPDVRVLNVEDHAPTRYLRTRTLENAGYIVEEAGSAQQAMTIAAADPAIRIALVDVGLPDSDGFDLCGQLKSHRPDLAVVMVSSIYRSVSARQQGIGMGADDYLLDPLPGYRLVRTLDRLLASAPRPPDSAAVITTDACGTILGLNAAACHLLNISARGGMGRSLLAFVGADRARIAKGLELAAAGQFVQEELILRPRERKPLTVEADLDGGDASSRTVEWTIQPI